MLWAQVQIEYGWRMQWDELDRLPLNLWTRWGYETVQMNTDNIIEKTSDVILSIVIARTQGHLLYHIPLP